jgi:DNA-directed RNA polymerase subunit RPC12/RpoP
MKKFQKNVEDFSCGNCGKEIKGDGYTNHCPKCLWSKHVDINPGDRASKCCGMMKPESYDKKGEEISVIHKCQKCGTEKKNKISKEDDFDTLTNFPI